MRNRIEDLLEINGVDGVVLLSEQGKVVFASPAETKALADEWTSILEAIGPARELDLIFEQGRLYIRKTTAGFLLVRLAPDASISMVKLSCDTVIPKLKPDRKSLFGR